ncbi:PREDICTED: protein Ycf2-like [Brassica oleracea var. oleracea]|uniref:protein Ycf2-like n=1 Tax=Brassica oleracea var. oleracea TaxID=109376 RepID=UPI0006A75742|nr:PREDICTED: protein Ycf2-like [Brassica oleracea var. oleracea]
MKEEVDNGRHVEELSDGNRRDDMCDPPSEGMKGLKRKRPSTGGGVSSRTRARKAVSNGNEPAREESNPVRGTTVVSLSLDTESEGMSAVSSKDGEKENSEKGEEEKDQEPEKDKENSDSVEKGEEYVEKSDEENSLLRLHERVRVQAEEFWRTIDDESEAEKEAEEEVEKEGEEEAEEEVQEEKEGEEEGEKEVQEEKEAEEEGEKEAEKETEKEVQEEKEAEKEESKGTPTSTGVIVITPRGRTKAAAARKAIFISPKIVVVTGKKTVNKKPW